MRYCRKTFWTIRTVESMVLIGARSSGRLMPALTLWNVSTFPINRMKQNSTALFFVLLYCLHLERCHVKGRHRFDELLKNSE